MNTPTSSSSTSRSALAFPTPNLGSLWCVEPERCRLRCSEPTAAEYHRGSSKGYRGLCRHFLRALYPVQGQGVPYGWGILRSERLFDVLRYIPVLTDTPICQFVILQPQCRAVTYPLSPPRFTIKTTGFARRVLLQSTLFRS